MTIAMKLLTGPAVTEALPELAALRIEIFREYPYLYHGHFKDELGYLQRYGKAVGGAVLIATDHGVVIGAATGMPLSLEESALKEPFDATGCQLPEIYYVGELLFYRSHRNRGLGMQLLARMEQHVAELGSCRYLTCVTVVRPDDHPLRPADYLPIDRFLARTGFTRLPGVTTSFQWRELDGQKQEHAMQFWLKELCHE